MRSRVVLGAFLLIVRAALAQNTESPLTFEVASVKPHPNEPGGSAGSSEIGGPGTKDPERIVIVNRSLRTLVITTYGIRGFQIEHPAWVGEARFDVVAKVPPGASKQDAKIMMRNLLAERFHLVIKREMRDLPVYMLMVDKGGIKMKPSVPAAGMPTEAPVTVDPGTSNRVTTDKNGMPQLSPGQQGLFTTFTSAGYRTVGQNQTIAKILTMLTDRVDRPVLDMTGLKGAYDFTLTWAPDDLRVSDAGSPGPAVPIAGGPSIYEAIQKQLGLKLDPRKAPIEMLVVVSADKVPAEN